MVCMMPGQGLRMQMLPAAWCSFQNFLAFFIPDDRINSEARGARAAGLHGIQRGLGGAEEAAGFRLPPGVHDDGFAFADHFVIPAPDFRLDGLADRGHVLEAIVVFLGLVGAGFAQHANGGGRSVEDVDVEAFGDAPRAPGIGELRHAFVKHAGGGQRQRAVNDVGVAGDPADVRHAPVDVFGMNVLIILGGAGDVGEIAAGAMLAAFGFAGGAAGVHEEERIFGVHGNGFDDAIAIILEDVVDEEVALHDHRRVGSVAVRIALPDQNLVDVLAFFFGGFDGDIGAGFVVHPAAVAVIAVGIDEDAAAGIGGAQAAGFAGEAAEHDGVNDAEASAGQHGDGQLRNHGHVDGDAIALLQSGKFAQHGGDFIHAAIEFLIGDDDVVLVFGLGNEDERGLVLVFGEMAVDAVVAGVQLAADKPFPERRMIGVQRGVPILIPVEKFGVLAEAFGEIFFAEAFDDARIVEIRLGDEAGRRANVLFFLPVHGDLRFGQPCFLAWGFFSVGFFSRLVGTMRTPLETSKTKRRTPCDTDSAEQLTRRDVRRFADQTPASPEARIMLPGEFCRQSAAESGLGLAWCVLVPNQGAVRFLQEQAARQ